MSLNKTTFLKNFQVEILTTNILEIAWKFDFVVGNSLQIKTRKEQALKIYYFLPQLSLN